MKQIKLKVEYSLEQEINRVLWTLKKVPWYREHGYLTKLSLPEGVSLNNLPTDNEIRDILKKEYNENIYNKTAVTITQKWEQIHTMGELHNLYKSNLQLCDEYIIKLTRYGTGGSYNTPNIITINFAKMGSRIDTIIHEIIHLSIEENVKKYELQQWDKEKIVCLLFAKIIPSITVNQNINDKNDIEKIFDKYYPDIEKIIIETSLLK